MTKSNRLTVYACVGTLWLLLATHTSLGLGTAPRQVLPGQLPPAVAGLQAIAGLPATNQLQLAISLPARNPAGLDALLQSIYDPASANYRHYLTPVQFADSFGASPLDYQAAIDFAVRNGLQVTGTHPNRLVLEVAGSVADIEKTFQINLRTYQHPLEARTFFAPDTEPSVEAGLTFSILSVSGLDNYSLPQPANLHTKPINDTPGATPNSGSGTGGTYMGRDFRLAYVPGNIPVNGAGQSVALLQFDGYYASDITAYEALASLPHTSLTNIAVNGGVSVPGNGGIEVSLDIEMVISMATNLAKIYVYEAPNSTPWVTILSRIANDNFAQQVSASWGGGAVNPNAAAEVIFKQMAAQGQSYFNASGDYDAYGGTNTFKFPMDSPNITVVGGTTLTTASRGGARVSETAWNDGTGIGTSGGISTAYGIPTWQQGITSFATNGGSTTARNVPDVALTADNIFVKYGNGLSTTVTGTSCASPLWAGFMALVNQKAASLGQPPAGFINPAVYEMANESIYGSVFYDITTGNNTNTVSPAAFYAVTNFDLCTGVGTPKGTNLINALANPEPLVIATNFGFNAVGTPAGNFNISARTYTLTNISSAPLDWSLINTSAWLSASSSGGTLAVGGSDSVVISLSSVGSNFLAGAYATKVWFSNVTTHVGHSRSFSLKTSDPLVLQPPTKFFFNGFPGGPFAPATQGITFSNPSPNTLNWSINNTSTWFNVSPASGSLAPSAQASVAFTPAPSVANLTDGYYPAVFQVTNLASQFVQMITGMVAVGIVQNGGFETGDFSNWTMLGNGSVGGSLYNGVVGTDSLTDGSGPAFIHAGTYGAFLGDTNLATLSQSFLTTPGQDYLLSFWFTNPTNGAGQQFSVNWITNSPAPNQIYFITNPPVLPWTNFIFLVKATGTNSTLQFGAENPPNGFGLDDVHLIALTPPVFTSQPTNLTIMTGDNATFSGAAGGFAPLSYQWLRNGTNLSDGGNLAGATSNVLLFTAASVTNGGDYTLVVTNNYGAITSSVATLTILLPPDINGVGGNPDGSFTLDLGGTPGYTYILEATTNLIPPIGWLPVATNTFDTNGVWQYTDLQATNFPQQYYRLKFAP